MKEFLDFISLEPDTILISVGNLLLLYLILKKFLFARVAAVVEKRGAEINAAHLKADLNLEQTEQAKADYLGKISGAEKEREEILIAATAEAGKKGEKIISESTEEARRLKQTAEKEIEFSKTTAMREAKEEIADISIAIAGKVIAREVNKEDHEEFIKSFINELEVSR